MHKQNLDVYLFVYTDSCVGQQIVCLIILINIMLSMCDTVKGQNSVSVIQEAQKASDCHSYKEATREVRERNWSHSRDKSNEKRQTSQTCDV